MVFIALLFTAIQDRNVHGTAVVLRQQSKALDLAVASYRNLSVRPSNEHKAHTHITHKPKQEHQQRARGKVAAP